MKTRKYFSEFGLGVYTSYKTIVPVEHLDLIDDERQYHIYSIMATPKIRIKKGTIKINSGGTGLMLTLEKLIKDEVEEIQICNFTIGNDLDYTKIKIENAYPYTNLLIEVYDKVWLEKVNRREGYKIQIPGQQILNMSEVYSDFELEVLYIGQAFGTDGNRLATNRLKSHSTLQKILTNYYTSHPDKSFYIFLYEFTPQLNMTFDGRSKTYSTTMTEDQKHMNKVLSNPVLYNQVINITEAAMINYFKPSYNKMFVDNFPDEEHKGYKQYFDLDYNNLVVEIDLEFDGNFFVRLWTENNRINNSFDMIQYNLFNDPNRKNMYEIFQPKDKHHE